MTVRRGSVVTALSGDLIVVPELTDGYMRLRLTEHRSTVNRNPKISELRMNEEQWNAFVTEGDRILSPKRKPRA